jgi:hypothetical protein
VLAGFYVSFGFAGFCDMKHAIELILSQVPFERSALFRASTMLFKLTAGASLSRGLVLIMVSLFMVHASGEDIACRTREGVGVRVIGEGLFREDPLFPA